MMATLIENLEKEKTKKKEPKPHDRLVEIATMLMNSYKAKEYISYRRAYEGYPKFKDVKRTLYKCKYELGKIYFITKEPKTIWSSIIPDVVGWWAEQSVVFECKISRSDFLSDKNKKGKTGRFFYYVAPEGIIKPEELRTEGLFEVPKDFMTRKVSPRHIKARKPCVRIGKNYEGYQHEISCLIAILRK